MSHKYTDVSFVDKSKFQQILVAHPRGIEDHRLVLHILIDNLFWFAILAFDAFSGYSIICSVVSGVLLSVVTFRAFGLMHECVHSSGHSKSWMNRWVGELYGVVCFLPFSSWKALHLDHHRWTGNVNNDPSMKILVNFAAAEKTVAPWVHYSWKYWIPTLGFLQHLVFWRASMKRREYLFLVGVLLYLALLMTLLSPLTLATGLIFYLYMVEIINFPHHLGMKQFTDDKQFSPVVQEQFVRSSIYPKWFARLVLLNFNLHVEHHAYPAHPWYQLNALNEALKASGESFNMEKSNQWIIKNRQVPVESVFRKTFEDGT